MNVYFFDPVTMHNLYDCSNRTKEQWIALGNPNVGVGILFIMLGLLSWVAVVPFMFVFVKADLIKTTSYRLMMFLCFVGCLGCFGGSFYAGYAAIVGMVFCMAPTWEYWMGVLTFSTWIADSTTSMILALNRCTEFLCPQTSEKLFGGKRVWLWLLVPVLMALTFAIFTPPTVFSSLTFAFTSDPFVGLPERQGLVKGLKYEHLPHVIHNFLVVAVMSTCYFILCFGIYKKTRGTQQICRIQLRTTILAIVICSGTFIASLAHIYIEFFSAPLWVSAGGQLFWQLSHVIIGIGYFTLNKTLRRAWLRIFCPSYKISPDSQCGASSAKKVHIDYIPSSPTHTATLNH